MPILPHSTVARTRQDTQNPDPLSARYPLAGPAKTPDGMPSGSFGPTTAGRMDSYVDLFQKNGGSMITLAKGNRSKQVTDACKNNGGFYLGSIGGPAAILGVPDAHMSLHFIVRLLWLMLMPLTMPTLLRFLHRPGRPGHALTQPRARHHAHMHTQPRNASRKWMCSSTLSWAWRPSGRLRSRTSRPS